LGKAPEITCHIDFALLTQRSANFIALRFEESICHATTDQNCISDTEQALQNLNLIRGSGSIEDDRFHQKSDEMSYPCLHYPPSLSHYPETLAASTMLKSSCSTDRFKPI
jgi:hypothetical protein